MTRIKQENLLEHIRELKQQLADCQKILGEKSVCDECDGSGWVENRVYGKEPCVCMTEAEPYQLLQQQLANSQAENLRLRKALESLLSWVDDWAETSDTDFPRIEALCREALYLSIPSGDMSALREVIAQVLEEVVSDPLPESNWIRSGEWTPEALK